MAGIDAGLATIKAYADDDSHGYSLRERNYDVGTDCAGLGRLYAAAVEGVDVSTYPDCHSWDIADVLGARGWQVLAFDYGKAQRGDVFSRVDPTGGTGHVVVYAGDGQIIEAANDFDGRRGDSSGKEICRRAYYAYGYKYMIRPPRVEEKPKVSIETVANGVYRLYNASSGQHLFTADHTEAETLANAGWTYEGVAFKAGTGDPVYRLYNPFGGSHMLTASAQEAVDLALAGYVIESVGFRQGTAHDAYRMYNPNDGDHMFTVDATERDTLVKSGWTDEGVGFKVD